MKQAPVQNSPSVPTQADASIFSAKPGLLFFLLLASFFSLGQQPGDTTLSHSISGANKEFSATDSTPGNFLSSKQKRQRQWLVAGINVAVYGGSLFVLHRAWYEDDAKAPFHTFDDSNEWLQVDKVGHAWTAYTTGRISTRLWQWAGVPHKKAVWIGGISGFVYLTGIEFLDAHSDKWGWSWGDIVANITGSGLFMAQEFLWKEQRIQFKFSFHKNTYGDPMLEERADSLYGSSFYERMLKDYNAQTYWLSTNIRSFFPKSNWPAWLNIAVGYGADGMFGGFENKWTDESGNEVTRYDIPRVRQFYLAPDIDFTKIKTKSKFLRTTFELLNSFKFPAPTLMIDSQGKVKAYAIYF
jgi:hypothetical protein